MYRKRFLLGTYDKNIRHAKEKQGGGGQNRKSFSSDAGNEEKVVNCFLK